MEFYSSGKYFIYIISFDLILYEICSQTFEGRIMDTYSGRIFSFGVEISMIYKSDNTVIFQHFNWVYRSKIILESKENHEIFNPKMYIPTIIDI